MTEREPRLQSLALQDAIHELDDLRGQALADAAFQRKVSALKRKAQREIFASFGKALEAFSPHWEALDKRHQFERERFEKREHTLAGRLLYAARAMPLTDFGAAVSHLRAGLASAQVRERGLLSSHGRERNDLAIKQRAYRLRLSKPHQDVLDMITVKFAAPSPAPVPETLDELRAKAARKRIALEIVRTMESPSKMMAARLGSRRTRRAAWEPEID